MKIDKLRKIENLLLLTKESLRQLEPNEVNLNFNLKYWIKKGEIIRVKKGRYILKSRFEKEENKEAYLEYLANNIYKPSYLSCEYVMNKYNLLTEAVYNITSISPKKTKIITNQLAKFVYYSLSPVLITGFKIKKFQSADIMIADKPKAVFDYLYLRFIKNTPINDKSVEDLRINWENLNKMEFIEIKKYADLSNNKKIKEVIRIIFKKYYD